MTVASRNHWFIPVRQVGREPGRDMEGRWNAEVAELAHEVTTIPEGKRAERERQLTSNSSRRWGCFIPHEPGL